MQPLKILKISLFTRIIIIFCWTLSVIQAEAQQNESELYKCGRVFLNPVDARNDVKIAAYLKNVEFKRGYTVADVGAENGYLSVALSMFTDSLSFYLEDISPVCLNQKEFQRVFRYYSAMSGNTITSSFSFITGYQNNTCLPENFFDIIMMNDVIHQLFYPDSFLTHLRTRLKVDGILYIGQYINNGITENEIACLLRRNGFKLNRHFQERNFNLFEFKISEPETQISNIHEAAICGDYEAVKKFLTNVNIVNEAGLTPLHYAAKYGHYEIVSFLIEKGANVNAIGSIYPISPLMLAVRCNQLQVASLLLKNKANVDFIFENKSVLMVAAANGNMEMVNMLINFKADRKYLSEGISYQFYAAESGSLPLMKYLFKIKEINSKMYDPDRKTLLFYAVRSGNLELVKYLIEVVKIDPFHQDREGKTALDEAGHNGIIDYLSSLKK